MADTPCKTFSITRVFNAPQNLVWKAWTDAECMQAWWGPQGFKVGVAKLDLKPGGIFHYNIELPGGHMMWGKFTYREINAPEKIVFIVSFSDEQEGVTRHPMSETWPLELLSTLTLSESNGKTTLTMEGIPLNANEAERKTFEEGFGSMEEGWKGTLDMLETYLAKA